MIDLEMLDFLYDYQSKTSAQQRLQVASLESQATQIAATLQQSKAELLHQPKEFVGKVHQLKSAALVLCSTELNLLFSELNSWPLSDWNSLEVAQKTDVLLEALKRYQQMLQFLNSFLV